MRGRTRNLLENVLAFLFLVILVVIIFFVVANYTSLGKSLELESVKKEIAEKFKNEEKLEEKQTNIEDDKSQTLFEIKENKKVEENNETQIEKKTQKLKEEVTKVNTEKEIAKKEIKKVEEKKLEKVVKTQKLQEVKKESIEEKQKEVKTIEPIKLIEKKQLTEEKETVEDKPKKKEPVLSAKNLAKFNIINKFIRDTKTKINDRVSRLGITKTDKPRYANIRVTVLKDGSYEQLKLMDGNKEYFDLIKVGVLSAFPLSIDEKITDQFPRYFRMKIKE